MRVLLTAVSCLVCATLFAQEAKPPTTFEDKVNALAKKHSDEINVLEGGGKKPPRTAAEMQANNKARTEISTRYADGLLALALSDPKAAGAFDAANRAYNYGTNDHRAKVLAFWVSDCADNPEVVRVLRQVLWDDKYVTFPTQLAEKTKTRSIKAAALYFSALMTIERLERVPSFMDGPNKKPVPLAERQEKVDAAAKDLRAIVKEYGSEKFPSPRGGDTTITEDVKPTLYMTEHLTLGKTAPDFEAASLSDGKKHKLSEYRGKVVVVDFYTYKGGYSHDRSSVNTELTLVQYKFKDKPVEILSVSVDEKKESATKQFDRYPPMWPQLWDGSQGGAAEVFQISRGNTASVPFIIDAKGVIRGKHIYKFGAVNTVVADLLKEMEKK